MCDLNLLALDSSHGLPGPPPLDAVLTTVFSAPADQAWADLVPVPEEHPEVDLSDLSDEPSDNSPEHTLDDEEPASDFFLDWEDSLSVDAVDVHGDFSVDDEATEDEFLDLE